MSSIKAWPFVVIIFIVIVIFSGVNDIGLQSLGNSNLDNGSVLLIIQINSNLDDNFGELGIISSNLTNGTSFEGQDAFVQQFLESKEQASELSSFTNKIVSIPDLLILGVNQDIPESDLAIYKALVPAFILLILSVVIFVAIFGDWRIT